MIGFRELTVFINALLFFSSFFFHFYWEFQRAIKEMRNDIPTCQLLVGQINKELVLGFGNIYSHVLRIVLPLYPHNAWICPPPYNININHIRIDNHINVKYLL